VNVIFILAKPVVVLVTFLLRNIEMSIEVSKHKNLL